MKRALHIAREAAKDKAFPGGRISFILGDDSGTGSFGRLTYEKDSPPVDGETLYDLASVTKALCPAALCMLLVQNGDLTLETRVGDVLDGIGDPGLARATVRQLLSHSAGLPAWKPLFRGIAEDEVGTNAGRARMKALLFDIKTEYAPGTAALYSDLDVMLLGFLIERLSGEGLAALVKTRIFQPLGMEGVGYLPSQNLSGRVCAPTEDCPWRGRVLAGEVDDENTFAAGGVLGQAGLFGDASALIAFCRELLDGLSDAGKIFGKEVILEFSKKAFPGTEFSFCLGFDGRSLSGTLLPKNLGEKTFGHWGFTGTGLWVDPEKKAAVVLLTNRVHPSRENERINHWRPRIMAACLNPKVE